ncbi:Proline dipeptidase, partial [hydrothermal vent metagenome]
MAISKRTFLKTAGIGGAALAGATTFAGNAAAKKLPNIADDAQPISVDERKRRIAKAQRLMREAGIGALLLEAGSSLVYFTGVRWRRSERFTGAIIPATGEIAVVTPYFEEPSIRETMAIGDDIRTWHENENPFALVAGILKDRDAANGKLAIEDTVRHFIVDGVQNAARNVEIVSGAAITRGCRMYKSAAEIALMQTASDITMAAY